MKRLSRFASVVAFVLAVIAGSTAQAVDNTGAALVSAERTGAPPPLIRHMVGTWDVVQRMWPGPKAAAISLPPAIAGRRLIGTSIVEETMRVAPGSQQPPFTRVSYFDYNDVSRRFEYFSLDTRAPQMMNERSRVATADAAATQKDGVTLYGGTFVAPRWGQETNVAFRYRIQVGPIEHNRQTVRLYLTSLAAPHAASFLAFEYVYTRRP